MQDQESDISKHILPVAATMVGVCITVITVMQIAPKDRLSSWADVLVAVDSLLFLASTIFSYLAIRPVSTSRTIERYADRFFIIGMIFMVLICFIVSFELFVD
jgi:hypothetical protein